MATINSLISANVSKNGSVAAVKKEIADLKSKSGETDSAEYKEKMADLKERLGEATASAVSVNANAVSGITSLFSYMGSGNGGQNFNDEVFFGSGNVLAGLKAMNSARIGIQNQARTLSAQISLDRAKGYDVSAKQETLANLVGNLDILDKNLENSINKAISDNPNDREFISIVDKLRKSLEDKPKETEEEDKPEETEKTPDGDE
ncbi:MAG: hypothetical protein LBI38_05660 [Oscillospiraceae bacterium]|jgi:hypothetical protein|nr:hypothetical protein [Oscillospiraceae bacterium]